MERKHVAKADIRLKDGRVITRGSIITSIDFNRDKPIYCQITVGGITYKTTVITMATKFTGFRKPSWKMLEKWSYDGIAKSLYGEKIEPDGWDIYGTPSWLLAYGVI